MKRNELINRLGLFVYELEILDKLEDSLLSNINEVRFDHATKMKYASVLSTLHYQREAIRTVDWINKSYDDDKKIMDIIERWILLCTMNTVILVVITVMRLFLM